MMPRHAPLLALATAGLILAATPGTFSQGAPTPPATPAPPATADGEPLDVLRVQNNVYAIFGAGGNITVQIGEQGPLLVDAGLAGTSDKVLAAVKTLSNKPIHDVVNTHIHPDHVGGNQAVNRRRLRQRRHHRRWTSRRDGLLTRKRPAADERRAR